MVQSISSSNGPEFGDNIKLWSDKGKAIKDLPWSEIIHQHNKHMGGVDLCDILLAWYRVNVGTRNWCFLIIYYFINEAIFKA